MVARMSAVLDALPGTPMRVAEVIPALAKYWQDAPHDTPTSRASQMNLVLVFGRGVGEDSAREQMDHALALARRYPCRIVVLCPDAADAPPRGRLHIACYPAANGKSRRCGEALLMSFPAQAAPESLENQVSVWLESDLPVYVWLHGVDAAEASRYARLVRTARRVVYDSSACGGLLPDAVWPKPEIVRDLARSRTLAVRQSLGQFLSAYAADSLVRGLVSVQVRHAADKAGEATHLLEWMRERLDEAARRTCVPVTADFRMESRADCKACLSTEWRYADGGFFRWEHAATGSGAQVAADIAGVSQAYPLRVPFLEQPVALAESLFF